MELEGCSVYKYFQSIGCCESCCLRFLGEKLPAAFNNPVLSLLQKGFVAEVPEENGNQRNKQKRRNPCITCLGLLHPPYLDDILNKVINELEKLEYDCETFYIALTLPVAILIRAESIWIDLQEKFPKFVAEAFPHNVVTSTVKDAWKWCYIKQMENKLNKKYSYSSELHITLNMSYQDEAKDCECLFNMFPDSFSKNRNRKYLGNVENFSRKSAENSLKNVTKDVFKLHYSTPPPIPNKPVEFKELTFLHSSIYVAGRYNKWSRHLPQTPWILGGVRKMESSVEELICVPILKLVKAQEYKFASSGREDVDVRTLGKGRPFNVELIDPKKTKFNDLLDLEKEINEIGKEKIFIRDLQIVSKESVASIKIGEEEKTKTYCALCIRPDGERIENLEKLHSLKNVVLEQSTPLRVLHRRPVAVRNRSIHWMETSLIPNEPDKFILRLNTQAGTYIKEFIHGDFGRTKPALGDLLGGIELDILALDVEQISLDWPPPVNYNDNS